MKRPAGWPRSRRRSANGVCARWAARRLALLSREKGLQLRLRKQAGRLQKVAWAGGRQKAVTHQENTKRIRREYDRNTIRIRRQHLSHRLAIGWQQGINWLGTRQARRLDHHLVRVCSRQWCWAQGAADRKSTRLN